MCNLLVELFFYGSSYDVWLHGKDYYQHHFTAE